MWNYVTKTWLYGTRLYYVWFSQHNGFGSVRECVEYWRLSSCFHVNTRVVTCRKIMIISFEIMLPSILSVLERTADPPTQSCMYWRLVLVGLIQGSQAWKLCATHESVWHRLTYKPSPIIPWFENCSTIFLRAFTDYPQVSMQLCSCLKNVLPVSFITFWWVEIEVGSTENQMIRGCITTASYSTRNPISFHLASAL